MCDRTKKKVSTGEERSEREKKYEIKCVRIREVKSKTYFKGNNNVLWLVIGGKHPLVTFFGTGQNDALSAQ